MHIFEYSGITESIPSDIFDTITEIESIRALDPLRRISYAKELDVAKYPCINQSASTSLLLEEISSNMSQETVALQLEGLEKAIQYTISERETPTLDEKGLLHLHRMVTNGYTKRDSRFRLRDREDIQDDHVRTIKPVRAQDIGSCIEQMASSFDMANNVGIQPMLLAPNVVLDFLNIHPFQEANWRMSRILLESLLVSKGYCALEVSSLDESIGSHADDYYDAVAESSSGWNNNDSDPFPFIRFISERVLDCYRDFERRYPLNFGRKMKKNERIFWIVDTCGEPISKTGICKLLPDVSVRTADVVLTRLISEGRIKKIGTYKDAKYASKN